MTVKSKYGHALYLLAKECTAVEEIKGDLTVAYEIFRQNPEYSTILDTPAISKGEKLALIDEGFKALHENVVSLIKILSEKPFWQSATRLSPNIFIFEGKQKH